MAKVKMNPVVETLRGAIGDLVFRRRNGKVVVARKPETAGRSFSTNQLAHLERFRQAAATLRPIYESASRVKDIQPFPLAVGDFFNAPTVDAIVLDGYTGKPGEQIVIRARDDIAVASVSVAIRNGVTVLEQGAAVLEQGSWRHTTQTLVDLTSGSVTIEATAADHPGNRTTATATK